MVMSYATARQMVASLFRGNLVDLRKVLNAIVNGECYVSGAGAPTSTPAAIGQRYYDTTNKVWYRATGTSASTDWNVDFLGGSQTVAGGATLTLTAAAHAGRTILLDTAAGTVVTLPAASGSGNKYRCVVKTLATSNSHKIQVANGTDIMQGAILAVSTAETPDLLQPWITAADSDTITLNRTTSGSVTKGEFIEIQDIAAGVFAVYGMTTCSGTEVTPFSAAV